MVVEAAYEDQLAVPGLFQRTPVSPKAHLGKVRRKRKSDQPLHAGSSRLGGTIGDKGRRMLHAHERRQPELIANRGGLGACDRSRRRISDGSITGLQLLESISRGFAAAPDVREVV